MIHDWNDLLTRMGLLRWSVGLGRMAFGLGIVAVVAAIVIMAGDLLRQLGSPRQPDPA